jgi:hypothetical protein
LFLLQKLNFVQYYACMHSHMQVCEGTTGHTEAVKVVYDKRRIPYRFLCDIFWESHDPTNKDYLVINFFSLEFITVNIIIVIFN